MESPRDPAKDPAAPAEPARPGSAPPGPLPGRTAGAPAGGDPAPQEHAPGDRGIDPEGIVWTRVSPRHTTLVLVSGLAATLFWTAAVGWPAVLVATGTWSAPLPLLALPPAAVLLIGAVSLALAPRRVRAIGYAERGEDLLVRRGLLYQRVTVIPYGRMQYVDVSVSPLQRALGLATVRLHTAAVGSHAEIPGVEHAEAARLRERLTARGEALLAGL
ncbi:PH domain-containing protein [Kocuria flava]|uniref:PH domain-containing protein n=1 Tax=Kocuria flava TaxID=446860 RepID=UPI002F93EB8A